MPGQVQKNIARCVRAGLSILCFSSPVLSDGLLIERNARPLLAEGSLEALAPWETPLEGFFVRSHHNTLPTSADDSWAIQFTGLLSRPKKITVRELKRRKVLSFHAVLECSGNGRGLFSPAVSGIQWKRGAVGNAEWTGVMLEDVIKDLGVKADAEYVTVEGFDEPVMKSDTKFIRSIPLKLLLETKAILAWNMNRQPMPLAHGGPIRLVMPGIYGQNWIKWVNKMTFSKEPDQRMYAKKAYRMPDKPVKPGEAWDPVKQGKPVEYIKAQTIFTSPWPGAKVAPGSIVLRGKTFTGQGQIIKVDISLDGGKTWKPATLSPAKDHAWQEFEFEMTIAQGQSYESMARATDSLGTTQPLVQEWNPKGYLYNAADRINFVGDKAGSLLAEGQALASTYCQTCHSMGIAEGQRLTKSDWTKTIKKMADYGLILTESDTDKIAAYFSDKYPPGTPTDDSKRVELGADPSANIAPGVMKSGNAAKGGKLFAAHCATCHGGDGRGNIGPVLKGRSLTNTTFWSSVINGKRKMPAYKDLLVPAQIADIRAWLEQPIQQPVKKT